jgi:predicted nucleic acid-binding protein
MSRTARVPLFASTLRRCADARLVRHTPAMTSPSHDARGHSAAPVVADSSILIGLARAGGFERLRERFGTLTITRRVKDEVLAGTDLPGARELTAAMRAGWIRVAPTPLAAGEYPELGDGEASTLALALERNGALVLMDDAAGRECAAALGLQVLGLAEL